MGEFTDDYTLIKLAYIDHDLPLVETHPDFYNLVDNGDLLLNKKDQSHAIESYRKALDIKKDKEVFHKLLDIYYTQKDYKNFIPLCEEYLSFNPMDSDYFFKISYAYKFIGNLSLAMDYGECLKLRDPRNINNLLNLSDLNRKAGNLARANKLLSDVLYLDPGNLKAQELQKMLEEK